MLKFRKLSSYNKSLWSCIRDCFSSKYFFFAMDQNGLLLFAYIVINKEYTYEWINPVHRVTTNAQSIYEILLVTLKKKECYQCKKFNPPHKAEIHVQSWILPIKVLFKTLSGVVVLFSSEFWLYYIEALNIKCLEHIRACHIL